MSGCTSQTTPPVVTAAPTTATAIATTTATAQTATPIPIITTSPATITTTALPKTDPILHRWVRQYPDNKGIIVGYEFKFYPDGTVNYRYGSATMISDNIKIDPQIEASGTWMPLGNNTYLVKFLPSGTSGAQLIREYTLVPAHEEKLYPGVVIREHIESSYETDAINTGQERGADEMYYPEKAKID